MCCGETLALLVAGGDGSIVSGPTFGLGYAGAEANVASWLALLGIATAWSGVLRADPLGRILHGLETVTNGAQVIQLAAPQTLMARSTDSLLDEYAPHAERRSTFPGNLSPVDTTRAQRVLGFSPQFALNPTQYESRAGGDTTADHELRAEDGAGT